MKSFARHQPLNEDGELSKLHCNANAWYDSGLEGFAGGDVAWDTSDIRLILIDEADDTIDLVVDDFLDDRAGASRVAVSSSFAGKANDVTLTSVTGDQSESIDIYCHDGGADAARRLLLNFDTATGLPITPDGGNITVQWDNGTNKIARL
jgi:hypothetical protein